MGIDLTVLASYFREHRGEFLPTASLRIDRDHRLFAQLSADATPPLVRLLPPGLQAGVYRDAGLAFTATDCYGKPFGYKGFQAYREFVVTPASLFEGE
jgi:hypothetical protein